MSYLINRRNVTIGLGSNAALLSLSPFAKAGWLGDTVKSIGGFYVGAAKILSGWTVVDSIDTANKALHEFRDVLQQVSTTLNFIQTFVQECTDTLHDIDKLLKDLPEEIGKQLSASLDANAARTQLGIIKGQSANLKATLVSKGSVEDNSAYITQLCREMVVSMSQFSELEHDVLQFTVQTVPALTTWMNGYSAYNALKSANVREINPWDHDVVRYALPRIQQNIDNVKSAKVTMAKVDRSLAVKVGTVYRSVNGGEKFAETSIPFKWAYRASEIPDFYHDKYYCICPADPPMPDFVKHAFGAGFGRPGDPMLPKLFDTSKSPDPDDFFNDGLSYLVIDRNRSGFRYWASNSDSPQQDESRAYSDVVNAIGDAERTYRNVMSFHQLMDGSDAFEKAVNINLVEGSRDTWRTMQAVSR